MKNPDIALVVPMELHIGERYHTTWSKNPHMTWKLAQIFPSSGTVKLKSKNSAFECKISDLRIALNQKKSSPARAKQLHLEFLNQLVLK